MRIAGLHGTTAQLATVASNMGMLGNLPQPVAEALAALRKMGIFHDRTQALLLSEILEKLHSSGIPVMVLKGLSLAERLYADPVERPAKDLDILVPRESMAKAGEIIEAIGFRPHRPEYYKRTHFHIPFFRAGNSATEVVELHWDVTLPQSPVRFRVERWWAHACRTELRAGNVLLPPPAEELSYLSYHAFSLGMITLRDLADISRLHQQLDPGILREALAEDADSDAALPFLIQALSLAEALWGIDSGIMLTPGGTRCLRRWFSRNLFAPGTVLAAGTGLWWPYRNICHWSLLPRKRSDIIELVEMTMGGWSEPDRLRSERNSVLHHGKLFLSLLMAMAFCCLPLRLFPHSPRSS